MHLIINLSDIQSITDVRLCNSEMGYVVVLFDPEKPIILCDSRMSGTFDTNRFEVRDTRDGWREVLSRYQTLFTDPETLTFALQKKIEEFGPKLLLEKSPVVQQRLIKNSHEIALLNESVRLNKKVYEMILPFLISGVTEEYIARKIQMFQLEL